MKEPRSSTEIIMISALHIIAEGLEFTEQTALMEAASRLEELSQECEKLRRERDKLLAHTDRLLSVSGLDSDWPEVAKIINETPAISLAEVRAQAIVDFVSSEVPKLDPDNPEKLCPETHHCEYTLYRERERIHSAADRIRKDTNA